MASTKVNRIQNHLDKINDLAQKQVKGTLSAIERDILLESLREVYKTVYDEGQGTQAEEQASKPSKSDAAKKKTKDKTKKDGSGSVQQVETKSSESKSADEQTTDQEKKDESGSEPQKSQNNIAASNSTEKREQKEQEASLNEKFGQKQSELSDKLKEPVNELKSAIGVNERYAFLHELFNGNKSAYNGALKYLDNCKSFDQAKAFMDELSPKYGWEKSKEVRKELEKIVKRKFQ